MAENTLDNVNPDGTRAELTQLFSNLSSNDVKNIFLSSLKEAASATVMTKITSLGDFVEFVFTGSIQATKYIYKIIKEEKWKFPARMFRDFSEVVRTRALLLETVWKSMSDEERKDTAIDFLVIVFSAFIVGGGVDMEGGMPDLDIKTGIGNHRNVFSHTILLGLTLELALRFLGNILINLDERGIKPSSKLLSSVLNFVKDKHEKAIQGMWIGLFFHYLKDANLLSAKTKPYAGLNGLSMGTHKGIFASNAILSAIFATNVDAKKVDEEKM